MICLTAAAMSFPLAHAAALQPAEGRRKELVKVSLVSHDTAVKPGDTLQLGVVVDVAKDWHIYWPGQNDTGMQTAVELSFPEGSGLTAGAVSFPLPVRHVEAGEISLNYILEKKVVLTVPVKVPSTAKVGSTVKIGAKVSYLVCKEACQPGEADVSTTVTIADKPKVDASAAKLIDDARAAQPKAQAEGFDAAATAKWEVPHSVSTAPMPQTLVIEAKEAGVTEMAFYPAEGAAKLLNPIKTGQVKGKTLRLTFEAGSKPVEGVVELKTGNTSKAWSFRMTPPSAAGAGAPAKPAAPAAGR